MFKLQFTTFLGSRSTSSGITFGDSMAKKLIVAIGIAIASMSVITRETTAQRKQGKSSRASRDSGDAYEELLQARARKKSRSFWGTLFVYLVGLVVLGALLVVGAFFLFRCPNCNKTWGLKLTEQWSWGRMEMKCKHCMHYKWKLPEREDV